MSKNIYTIVEYDEAMTKLISDVINGWISLDPLFGQMRHNVVTHSGPIRNVRGIKPLDQPLSEITSESKISMDDVQNLNIEANTEFLLGLAKTCRKNIAIDFFSRIREVTEATGNVVDAQNKPFSWDYYIDLLEGWDLEFDAENKPILPQMIIPPKMIETINKSSATVEQQKRAEAIIERKRMEFNAKKRTRRIS
jgi:hypothetical protein